MKIILFLASFFGLFLAIHVHAATLDLVPTQTEIQTGDSVTVDVMLDTQGADIDGVDLYSLHFDPQIFSATVTPGDLMPYTVYEKVDNVEGTVKFSQLSAWGSTFNGTGILATITLTAKTSGESSLYFDFILGSTIDTNVAAQGQDVLTSVGATSLQVISSDTVYASLADPILISGEPVYYPKRKSKQ